MNLPSALAMDSIGFQYVLEPAVRALLLAAVVWLLLTAFRIKEVSIRLAAWTIVLYAALAMPFLSRIVPEIPLPVPSSQTTQTAAENFALSKTTVSAAVTQFAVYRPAEARRATAQQPMDAELAATGRKTVAVTNLPWPAIVWAVYWLVAAIFLARFVLGLISGRRLRRASTPIADKQLDRLLARETCKAGFARAPQLVETAALSVPATLSLFRPVILLPVEWNEWTESQTSAVLAHELSHVARRDGLTQALSRLHRAFFWFSPLSWWLDRALVELAEQASDDAALRSGVDRIGYAEVLLHFFRALKAARRRVRWEGVSMAQGSRSRRRVERILQNASLSRGLGLTALVAVVLAAAPLICLAAAIQPSRADTIPMSLSTSPPAPPAMALTPVSLPAPAIHSDATPAARRLLPDGARRESRLRGLSCHGHEAFAVVSGRFVMSECASVADLDRVWNLHRRIPGGFVWFRKDGGNYIVENPATVRTAFGAFARLLGMEQRQAILQWKESGLLRDPMDLARRAMAASFEGAEFAPPVQGLESAATPRDLSRAQAEFAWAEWNAMQNSMARMAWAEEEDMEAAGQLQAALDGLEVETVCQAVDLAQKLIAQSLTRGLARSL